MDAVRLFNNELSSLYESKPPISRAKMTQVTKMAIKAIKFYKHVVQSVEKFIQKCRPEYKVPGLYVIDSIVRQSRHQFGPEKDVFAPRFAKNIVNTFQFLFKCPPEGRAKIVRVLNLWQKNSVFSADIIQPLLDMANPEKAAAVEATVATPAVPKHDKPDVKAWLSQATEPKGGKAEAPAKDDTLSTVQQILQQTQQQQIQQQQLQQLQQLQQQLEQQKQATDMSASGGNTGLVLDSHLVEQIQTLTAYLSTLTGKVAGGSGGSSSSSSSNNAAAGGSSSASNSKPVESSKPAVPTPVPAPSTEAKALGFNKALLDFDYGDEEEEETKETHPVAVPQPKASGMEPNVQAVQRLTEELKNAQSQQEFLRQQLRQQSGMPAMPPGYAKMMQPPEPEAPPEPAADVPAVKQDTADDEEMLQMQKLQQEAAAIEEQQQQRRSGRRHHENDDQEEGEIVSSHKRSRHRDRSRSRSRSPKRRRSRSRSRSRSGSRSRSRSKRKKRSRSRSRSRRSKRSRSRDRHERRRERDEEERRKEKEKREMEREREKKGLPPLKEKHLSVCTKTLWVGRLPKLGAETELRAYLEDFGPIAKVDLVPPRGCAYVCMENRLDAYKALERLRRGKMFGNSAKIAWAPGRGVKEYKQYNDFWEVEKGVTYIPWDHLPSEVDLNELSEGAAIDEDTLPPGMKLELPVEEVVEDTPAPGVTQPSQIIATAVESQPSPASIMIPGLSLVRPNMAQPLTTIDHAVPNTLQAMPIGARIPGPAPPTSSQPQAVVPPARPEMVRMPVFQTGMFPPFVGYSPQMPPPPGFRFPPGFQAPPTTANTPVSAVPPSGVPPPSLFPRGVPPPTSQPGLPGAPAVKAAATADSNKPSTSDDKPDFKIPGLGGDPVSIKTQESPSHLQGMPLIGVPRPGFPISGAALQRNMQQLGGTPTSLMGIHPGALPPGFSQDIRLGVQPPILRPPGPVTVSQPENSNSDPAKQAKNDEGRPSTSGANEKGDMGPPQGIFAVPKPPTSLPSKIKDYLGQRVPSPGMPIMPSKKDVDMREEKVPLTGANHLEGGSATGNPDQDKMGHRPPMSQEHVLPDGSRFPPGMRLMRPIIGIQGQPLIQRAVAPGFRMRLPGPGQQFAMQGQVIRIPNQGMQPGGPQLQMMGMRQIHPGMIGGSVRGMIPPQGIATSGGIHRPGGVAPPGGMPQPGGMPPPGGMLPQGSLQPPQGGIPPRGAMPPPTGVPPNSRLQAARGNQGGQQEAETREPFQPGMRGRPPQIEGGRVDSERNQDAVPERSGAGRSRWGPPVPPAAERDRMLPDRGRPAPEPLIGKGDKDFSERDVDMRERKWPERGWHDRDDRERGGIGMRDQDWRMPPGGPRGPDWSRDRDDRGFLRPDDRDIRRPDFGREWKRPGDRDMERDHFRPDLDRGREAERNLREREPDRGGFRDRDRDFGRGRDRDRERDFDRDSFRNRDRDRDRDWRDRDRERDRDRRDRRDDKPREGTKEQMADDKIVPQKSQQPLDSNPQQSPKPLLSPPPSAQTSTGILRKPSETAPQEATSKQQTPEAGGSALPVPAQAAPPVPAQDAPPVPAQAAPPRSPQFPGLPSAPKEEPTAAAAAPEPHKLNPLAEAFVPSGGEEPSKAKSPKGLYADVPDPVQSQTQSPQRAQVSESEQQNNGPMGSANNQVNLGNSLSEGKAKEVHSAENASQAATGQTDSGSAVNAQDKEST
ncbi:splicing factor, arginine/serine-rich 15-like isoform X2 [Acanthaster planci]|uniref:Splicing factor, arginine/serine-rich 15-like isoform X2 n=1 Tax=Acanthaster planci TaxID=133434 RepID=A0A8B7YNB7_ACAPL|nr:splicing factor, arginine/serine-rich 15-like isoform X2 [Acanthaster planci]